MPETFFQLPSMSLDLSLLLHQFRQAELSGTMPLSGTLPGTLFLRLSAVRALSSHPFCRLQSRHGQYLCLVEWAVKFVGTVWVFFQ